MRETQEISRNFLFSRYFTQESLGRMLFGQRRRGGRKWAGTKQQQPGGIKTSVKTEKTGRRILTNEDKHDRIKTQSGSRKNGGWTAVQDLLN